jgi:hypothetical protein
MIRQIVAWALGPSGELVLNWYSEHNLLINGPIVIIALLGVFFPRQRQRFMMFVRQLWLRLPLGATEEELRANQQASIGE